MALPKALLCILGPRPTEAPPQEALLRAAGFATATIAWPDLTAQPRGWMQLLPLLDQAAVQAWVLCGPAATFTTALLSRIALLTLALKRPVPPLIAFVLTDSGEEPAVAEPLLAHVRMFHGSQSFAAKLMAARTKPQPAVARPFHLAAHLDPCIGQWLELGPGDDATWNGFMAGVMEAEVVAFGVGPRGRLPRTSVLHFPQCGIRGNWGAKAFTACAARNEIDRQTACYLRVEGCPQALFVTGYPEEDPGQGDAARPPLYLALG